MRYIQLKEVAAFRIMLHHKLKIIALNYNAIRNITAPYLDGSCNILCPAENYNNLLLVIYEENR